MVDLKHELQQLADDAARQARPMAVGEVIQAGDRRHRRIILTDAMTGAGALGRAHSGRWRSASVAGLVAALTGALIAVVVPSGSAARAPRVITVADLANLAATAAAKQPDIRPDQWIYRKTLNNAWGGGRAGLRIVTSEMWSTADGSEQAFYSHGKLVVERSADLPQATDIPYRSLGSLSASPHALLARFACRADSPLPRCQSAFIIIGMMLTNWAMRPSITANLYHALADIPGVKVEMKVADLAGRSGIAFAYPLGHRIVQEIILNKRTYTYMGSYFGVNVPASKADGQALLRQARVSGPGIRP
jgi:hypothetical protein